MFSDLLRLLFVRSVFFIIIVLSFFQLEGQNLYSFNTEWDDDYRQWEIALEEGEIVGTVQKRWRFRNDISEWDFRINGETYAFSKVWDNDLNKWQLKSSERIVSISTIWSNDFNSFRISDGAYILNIERKHYNDDPIEWTLRNDNYGSLYWFNEFEYDLRDWIVEDQLSEEVPLEIKLAAVFITILFSIM